MDLIEQFLHVRLLERFFRRKRVKQPLVLAGNHEPAFDAELFHRLDETEAVHHDPDGADDAGPVRIDLVGGHGSEYAARGTDIGDHGVQGFFGVKLTQARDLAVDVAGLHRTSSRAIDLQDHGHRTGILEGRPQSGIHVVGAGRLAVGNDAGHLHHRRMLRAVRKLRKVPVHHADEEQAEIGKAQ